MTRDELRVRRFWQKRQRALEADIAQYGKSADPRDVALVGACWLELIREAEEVTE